MFIFKEQIHYLGHQGSDTSILQLAYKIEVLMKLKPRTNIKEVRHFLSLTDYYRKLKCSWNWNPQPISKKLDIFSVSLTITENSYDIIGTLHTL